MAEAVIIAGVVIIGIILLFGASFIITAAEKTSPMVTALVKDTEKRCDQCLKQFEAEGVYCTHDSKDRVCVALSNYYCLTNCTAKLK